MAEKTTPQKDSKNSSKDPLSSVPGGQAIGASTPSAGEIKEALKTGDIKSLAKKTLKRFLWTGLVELIPVLGGIVPTWTILVYKEMKANLVGPEGILMLCIASLLDIVGFIIFILGTWFAIDDYGILDAIGGIIIGGWLLLRYSSLGAEGGMKVEKEDENTDEEEDGTSNQLPEKNKTEKKTPERGNKEKTGSTKQPSKSTKTPTKK